VLAQNFKTAADLDITEQQRAALMKVLVLLETGKIEYTIMDDDWPVGFGQPFTGHFNMHTWGREAPCGTVACIGGTAERIGNVIFKGYPTNERLGDLFEPRAIRAEKWKDISPSQAATALRSYLSTGNARWDLAVTIG